MWKSEFKINEAVYLIYDKTEESHGMREEFLSYQKENSDV